MNYLAVRAFTLIEMLVVLVILALTTTLLSQGLETTWRNFEKLGARDLANSSAQLPLGWFENSIRGALLYHPEQAFAQGDEDSFQFISFNLPDDPRNIPQPMIWQIEPSEQGWQLRYQRVQPQPGESDNTEIRSVQMMDFAQKPRFSFLHQGNWQPQFPAIEGMLPEAVRLIVGDQVIATATPGRPALADIPAELPAFGVYEFGG
ncbi:PulJ/GspJ family protein [Lacimicrobium alkaliphilum]|uniref:Type II secretion system protein GspJ n=1 Tax=Lacimicrobium alkaliphilum TaxID=1526571 RepID=A0ABQ1R8F3_9ALTE|nr:prepilin-type N-terminal cleavage/methylation domain-containing protein [Lacimicrobium alkaliphilum]GGD57577.1 hypothetical protein GCM10011357_11230 [Lacimicrobium alkaliphilum]